MKKLAYAAALALIGCTAANTESGRVTTVTVPLDGCDGHMAYLIDYDSEALIDSAVISQGKAVITTKLDSTLVARVLVDGSRKGLVILEPGEITVDTASRMGAGTPLNDALVSLSQLQDSIASALGLLATEITDSAVTSERDKLLDKYYTATQDVMQTNRGNILGRYLVLQEAYEVWPDGLDSLLTVWPEARQGVRMQRLLDARAKLEATSPGKMFLDFEVADQDTVRKLSDYVGRGQWTLVDFWASWCAPCMKEMGYLKQLYADYTPKGLQVVGVAVWDERAASLAAVQRLALPWPQILDAQRIPTDLYGITSIPTLILFDPDGRIAWRGHEGAEAETYIAEVLQNNSVTNN